MATPISRSTACATRLRPLSSIDGTDCIGDSRGYLNRNFENISDDLCSLFLNISSLSARPLAITTTTSAFLVTDSSTINLDVNTDTTNTYNFSATVVDGSIGTIKLGQDITTLGKRLLTSTGLPLSSLSDVQINGIQLNQVLAWNGSKWVNNSTSLSGQLTVGNKGDIFVGGPTSDNVNIWSINENVVNNFHLAIDAVLAENISQGAVLNTKIGPEAVSTAKLSAEAVTTVKIAPSAVTTNKIQQFAITTDKILPGDITNTTLANTVSCSIKGNPTNTTTSPTDIQATNNDTVLIRQSNTLAFGLVPNSATTATSATVSNTIVLRNSSGDFSTNEIFANEVNATTFYGNLIGNASTATTSISALSAGRTVLANRAFTSDVSLSALSADRSAFAVTANFANTANTANVSLSAVTAGEAVKLQTTRRFELSGVVLGSSNFNGTNTATFDTTFRSDIQDSLDLLNSLASFMGIRMSLSPTSPITTTDIKNATTLYIHPFGNTIVSLWNTTTNKWQLRQFNSVLPVNLNILPANTNYDVYLFFNSGTDSFQVEFVPWSSQTPGATPPATDVQNGVLVKLGSPSKRLIGCIRTTNAGQTEVSFGRTAAVGGSHPKLFVWNYYNQQPVSFSILETGNQTNGGQPPNNFWRIWALNSATGVGNHGNAGTNGPFGMFGGNGNKISFVSRIPLVVSLNTILTHEKADWTYYGFSLDLETPTVAELFAKTPGVLMQETMVGGWNPLIHNYNNTIDPGYHYLQIVVMTYGKAQRFQVWTGDRHSFGTVGTIAAY